MRSVGPERTAPRRGMLEGMRREALEVAVIHHRTPAVLAQALERLAAFAPDVPVRVVDTAFDPSLAVQLDGAHPHLTWSSVPNHSFATAVNAAARLAGRPLLLHMNADVLIGPDTVNALLDACDDPRVAAAGPLARTPGGALQDQGLPYRLHHARLRWRRGRGAGHARVDVPWLSGCLQVLRLEALEAVGGFDARLRFYNEDLEWCLRARRQGWRCLLVDAEVVHIGGASSSGRPAFAVEGVRGGYALTRRHGPAWLRPLHRWGIAAGAWLAAQRADDPVRRAAWRALAERSARDELATSCLGARLDDEPLC
jgi:N-acetylglucosaminyl-diphospho-decaprenol L-rhamnosyltransferase